MVSTNFCVQMKCLLQHCFGKYRFLILLNRILLLLQQDIVVGIFAGTVPSENRVVAITILGNSIPLCLGIINFTIPPVTGNWKSCSSGQLGLEPFSSFF
jgi:hypothetical protein